MENKMDKKLLFFLASQFIKNEEQFELYKKHMNSFSKIIIQMNEAIESRMNIMHDQLVGKISRDDFILNLIIFGYMSSYMKYTLTHMQEAPFFDDSIVINDMMKELLKDSKDFINVSAKFRKENPDIYEYIKSYFANNKE